MRRKGSFSALFPTAPAPATQEPKRLPGSAYPEPSRLSLSLSLPLSSTQSSPREYEPHGTSRTSSTSSDAATAAVLALDRAVADVLSPSPSGSSASEGSRRLAMASRSAAAADSETMQGHMVIHAKKPKRKKLFTLNRSYFVVADASRPVLEVFANEHRTERVYLFSLAGAHVDFETDDVSHAVRAKCFCLNVQSWRKRGVDYLRPQGFVFYQENQALMMVWVKIIHVAIRRANAATKMPAPADDLLLFRRSEASTVGADDSSATESERAQEADAEDHYEADRESVGMAVATTPTAVLVVPGGCSPVLEEEVPPVAPVLLTREERAPSQTVAMTPTVQPVTVALPGPSRSPRRIRGQNRRRAGTDTVVGSSSVAQVTTPIPSPGTRAKPQHFGRLNTMLATMKNATHHHSNQSHSGPEDDKSDGAQPLPSTLPPSTRPKLTNASSFSPPSIMSSLHMPRGKSSSTRHVTGSVTPTTSSNTNKRLSDPFQVRKKDDTLFGGFPPFFSPKGPRSNPKQNAKHATRTGDVAPAPVKATAAATAPGAANSDQLNGSAGPAPGEDGRTVLEWRLSNHLARLVLLLLAFVGGVLQLSLFLPFAAAGVFVYTHESHADAFASAAIAALWVYVATTVQGSLGLCSIAAIVYGWSYVDFRETQWRRRRRLVERLVQEENDNFALIQFPNWVVRPDVDRVDWLNKVLANGWPFMKIAIRNSILDNVNPLLEASRPAFLSALSLVRVDLGARAPVITGVKFVSANTLTDEVTLDVDIRVVGDESLVAELRLVSALGAAAVVSLRDLLLAGTLRVTLSPLATYWPCFGAISLCFTERPLVDFSLTAAKINLSNVPFASEWLQTFLHDLLLDCFVWPKVTHIPLWDETGAPATSTPPPPL